MRLADYILGKLLNANSVLLTKLGLRLEVLGQRNLRGSAAGNVLLQNVIPVEALATALAFVGSKD